MFPLFTFKTSAVQPQGTRNGFAKNKRTSQSFSFGTSEVSTVSASRDLSPEVGADCFIRVAHSLP